LVVPTNGNGRIIKDRPAEGSAAFPSSGDNSKTLDPALMAVAGQQPDPDGQGITSCHQSIAVVLDLMHPVRPGWRLLTRRWQARLDEAGPADI
jgi:hypothetical protein